MADDNSSKQSRILIYLTLIGTALGVIAPIAWERYKSGSSIELQYLSALAIIEQQSSLKKLEIYYDKQPITTISKLNFALVNTGRTPIEEGDLIEKPRLIFQKGAQLLDIALDKSIPENLSPNLSLNRATNFVEISFPLLNPGDVIQFSVLTAGQPPDFHAEARIVGIKNLDVVDRVKEFKGGGKKISWAVYLVGLFTILSLVLDLIAISEAVRIRRYRIAYKKRGPEIPMLAPVQKYRDFETSLRKAGLTLPELQPLTEFIKTLPADGQVSAEFQKQFEQIMENIFSKILGSEVVSIIFTIVFAIGILFIYTNVF